MQNTLNHFTAGIPVLLSFGIFIVLLVLIGIPEVIVHFMRRPHPTKMARSNICKSTKMK